MAFDIRLRAYEPDGDSLGYLPEPSSLDVSFVHDDVGALSLTYSTLAAGGPVLQRGLDEGLEVGVEVTDHAGGWVEPRGGRFVLIGRGSDQADPTGTLRLTLPSYGWLLGKARNLDTSSLDEDQRRVFTSASAGTIMATLLSENATRGGIPLTATFTGSTDSAGAAWATAAKLPTGESLAYDLGVDLGTVLDNLASQGMCDWRTEGRTLSLWNPDTVCAPDHADSVRLWLGSDVLDAPSDESLEDVVSRMLIRGDDGLVLTRDNPSAPTPWGEWEGYTQQGGVSGSITATQLVQAELARTARVRGQYTRALILTSPKHLPMVDYGPGAWITAPTVGTGERVRVQQITLSKKEGKRVTGSAVLVDRYLAAAIRQARRIKDATGGASKSSGSDSTPPKKPAPTPAPGSITSDKLAPITSGGSLDVGFGGNINVGPGGSSNYFGTGGISMSGSGGIEMSGTGGIELSGGGDIDLYGGDIRVRQADGKIVAWIRTDPSNGFEVYRDDTTDTLLQVSPNIDTAEVGHIDTGGGAQLWTNVGDQMVTLYASGGSSGGLSGLAADPENLTLYLGTNYSTSESPNLHLNTAGTGGASGQVFVLTSSRRYKQDIEQERIDVDSAAILDVLAPRTWRDKAEVRRDPDTTARHVGTIAEDLHDAGLGQWVRYNDDGLPESIRYDRLTSLLAVVVQRQQAQLDDLTARIERLEGGDS